MKTIAMMSQKGGTGKTTIGLHLSVAAEQAGLPAVILDIDPQASSAAWKDFRTADAPAVISVAPARLRPALDHAREIGAKLAVIDTAGHSADAAMMAAEAADLALVPCRVGILDLCAIAITAKIVKLAGKPAYVVLNHAPPGAPRQLEDAIAAVSTHGLETAPAILHQRVAYAHSLTQGATAQEYEPGGKAAGEIAELFAWLRERLAL